MIRQSLGEARKGGRDFRVWKTLREHVIALSELEHRLALSKGPGFVWKDLSAREESISAWATDFIEVIRLFVSFVNWQFTFLLLHSVHEELSVASHCHH